MKQINVSVVGLSGVEKGVGKSCLCNRFVRPLNDEYFIDHISVLSQSDFSGRIVNNDHFLYWGEVRKTSEEGVDYMFNIVEQTEFVDDATFQPFKVGKMESYSKRCSAIRLLSAEKLVYICKNQLGIEREYDQIVLPDGRFSVDGFICVFDVSSVPNRSIEKQVEGCTNIIANLLKTKKPILLVTTKNDDANELYIREAEKICQRKEYKNQIQMIETSAHESINIDLAFIVLAQMIDKVKTYSKVITYQEAARSRKELLETSTEYVTRLIKSQIKDHRSIWSTSSKKLSSFKEWQDFLELFGQEAGQRIFRRHIKKLREEYTAKKLQRYMETFACVLQEILPDINSVNIDYDSDWNALRNYFRNHVDFDQYFFDCPQHVSWAELSDMSEVEEENKVPFEVLDTNEAESVFRNHINSLQQEQKRLEWKKQFKKLLEETGYVTPGKQLAEVRVLFMGRECFEALSEHDCQQIYDNHQRELIETAKHNFQELLLEHADLFYHFKSIEPSGTITQNDIKDITDVLQEDLRYKLLDRLDQDRKLMLFQHLGFVHCPIREHCPAFPNCVDALIERIIASNNHGFWQKDGQYKLNLIVVGLDYVSNNFIEKLHSICNDNGEYILDGQVYNLNIEVINRDNDSFSFDLQSKALIGVFSNKLTFQYVYDVTQKLIADNDELNENMGNLHLIFSQGFDNAKIDPNELNQVAQDAQQLAEKLHCVLIDVNEYYPILSAQSEQKLLEGILNSVIENIQVDDVKFKENQYISELPDIRIIMCMFCGDPYSLETIIKTMINEPTFISTSERNIVFEMFLGDTKRRVEVILSSYHGANAFRDELVHGFILLYSTKRKSSLTTLNAFSMNIPNLPMQIVAITEPGGVNMFFSNEICQILITEGNAIADKLRAHFITSTDENNQFKFASFAPFLKEVWDKKPEIEHAFHMEEPLTIDSGEGTMEHSHHHIPQPPPRFESYLINGTYRQNKSINSLDEMDDNLKFNNPNERQTYSNMYFYEENNSDGDRSDKNRNMSQGFQIFTPATTPPEPAPPDHLLTPSSILRQLKANAVSASQSSLDEINSDVSGSKESLSTYDSGWLDDGLLIPKYDNNNKHILRENMSEEMWKNMNAQQHAFTTGRRPNNAFFSKKVRPKGPSQTLKQPGKLNLKSFAIVNEALSRMNIGENPDKEKKIKSSKKLSASQTLEHAPLAAPEDDSEDYEEAEYEQINDAFSDAVNNVASHLFTYQQDQNSTKSKLRQRREKEQQNSESDSSSLERKRSTEGYSKINRKPQTHKRLRKKRVPIPVQPPKIPLGPFPEPSGMQLLYQKFKNDKNVDKNMHEEESSIDVSSPRETNSPIFGVLNKGKDGERDKLLNIQIGKPSWLKSSNADKEADKESKQKKKNKVNSKTIAAAAAAAATGKKESSFINLTNFKQSEHNLVPLVLEKCVQFIEKEGLDSEGIYRVPGNRTHVDLLYQKFDEGDVDIDIEKLDIPVNAVATALKDFFSKRLPPLFDAESMNELEEIAGSRSMSVTSFNMEVKADRSGRLLALRGLLNKLPPINFAILKFIFQHFVRVSENSKLNSMDSKNLAICWWPTLLPIEFTDMVRFESMRPYLEDLLQTMIDQYPFLFCGMDAFVMV